MPGYRDWVIRTSSSYVKFEVFTAVTMKNAVVCDIKFQFLPHRRYNNLRYIAQPVNAMQDLEFLRR
jgi:hypothetical protein